MNRENAKEKSLPELMAEKQMEIVKPYLELAYLRRELPELALLYCRSKEDILKEMKSEPIEKTVIDILANMVLDLIFSRKIKSKKNYPDQEIKEFLNKVNQEINRLYSAIKVIGFSSSIVNADKKWQDAALAYFDDSKKGFKYIKRSHLENKSLYELVSGKERETFFKKLSTLLIEYHLKISLPEYITKKYLMEISR